MCTCICITPLFYSFEFLSSPESLSTSPTLSRKDARNLCFIQAGEVIFMCYEKNDVASKPESQLYSGKRSIFNVVASLFTM